MQLKHPFLCESNDPLGYIYILQMASISSMYTRYVSRLKQVAQAKKLFLWLSRNDHCPLVARHIKFLTFAWASAMKSAILCLQMIQYFLYSIRSRDLRPLFGCVYQTLHELKVACNTIRRPACFQKFQAGPLPGLKPTDQPTWQVCWQRSLQARFTAQLSDAQEVNKSSVSCVRPS